MGDWLNGLGENANAIITIGSLLAMLALQWKRLIKLGKSLIGRMSGLWMASENFKNLANSVTDLKNKIEPLSAESVADKVNFLVACRTKDLQDKPWPGFECGKSGNNLLVTGAYLKLIGITRDSDLMGHQWMSVIAQHDREDYIEEFERCARLGVPFSRAVTIQNPQTSTTRGKWLVVANPIPMGGDIIYSGRMVAALDQTARSIASRENWQVEFRGDPDQPHRPDANMARIKSGLRDLASDSTVRPSVIFPISVGPLELCVPVGRDWTEVLPGLEVKWQSNDETGSEFLIRSQGTTTFPLHSHSRTEIVETLRGSIIDIDRGHNYKSGEIWTIPAGQNHQASFVNATARIRLEPACEMTTPLNVRLDGIERVLESV